jgi:hypothetical protein
MQALEKQELLEALDAGRKALREALFGVDDALTRETPKSGGWSILHCVEHVAISEQYLLRRLRCARIAAESLENRAREAKIVERATDRTRKIDAPQMSMPRGRFDSVGAAVEAFEAARAKTICYVDQCSDDLRRWATDHPLIPGPVNCYEILLMMAAHPARHAKQIAEIREKLSREDQ